MMVLYSSHITYIRAFERERERERERGREREKRREERGKEKREGRRETRTCECFIEQLLHPFLHLQGRGWGPRGHRPQALDSLTRM